MNKVIKIFSITSNDTNNTQTYDDFEFVLPRNCPTYKPLAYCMYNVIKERTGREMCRLRDYWFSHVQNGSGMDITVVCGRYGERFECVTSLPRYTLREQYCYINYYDSNEKVVLLEIKFIIRLDRPVTYNFEFLYNGVPYTVEFPSTELRDELVVNKKTLYRYDATKNIYFKSGSYYYALMYNNEKQIWEAGWIRKEELPPNPDEPNVTRTMISMEKVDQKFSQTDHGKQCLQVSPVSWAFKHVPGVFAEMKMY